MHPIKIMAASAALCASLACNAGTAIEFVVAGKAYSAELNDTATAKSLAERLPVSLVFEDYAGTERIAYPDRKLSIGEPSDHGTPVAGTFAYYQPWGNICVFMRPFHDSEDLYIIGKLSDEALDAVIKSGNSRVTIRVAQ